jgi:hypothetical protein
VHKRHLSPVLYSTRSNGEMRFSLLFFPALPLLACSQMVVVVVFSGSFMRYGWCACFMVVQTWIEFCLFHGLALIGSTVVVHMYTSKERVLQRRFSVVTCSIRLLRSLDLASGGWRQERERALRPLLPCVASPL